MLLVDVGTPNAEIVTVTGVSPAGGNHWNIIANFANTHNAGASINMPCLPAQNMNQPGVLGPLVNATWTVAGVTSNGIVPTVFGNPGPQPVYNPSAGPQPAFSARNNNAVVLYFSIIQ